MTARSGTLAIICRRAMKIIGRRSDRFACLDASKTAKWRLRLAVSGAMICTAVFPLE
jgi:hypothetical protein